MRHYVLVIAAFILAGCITGSEKEINGAYINDDQNVRAQYIFFQSGEMEYTESEGGCVMGSCSGHYSAGTQVISIASSCSSRTSCSAALAYDGEYNYSLVYKWKGRCLNFTIATGDSATFCPP